MAASISDLRESAEFLGRLRAVTFGRQIAIVLIALLLGTAGQHLVDPTGFALLLTVGIIYIMFLDNPQLALISLLPMFPLVWMTSNFGTKIGRLFFAVDNAVGDVSNRLQENVVGVQVVRAFAREPYETQRFEAANKHVFQTWVHVIDEWSKIMPTSHWLTTVSVILILWFGGQMVLDGTLTIGAIVAFNAYILMMAEPAQQLTSLVNAGGEAAAGAQRVFEVLDTEPEIQSPAVALRLAALRGEVEFRDVGLKYQDESTASLSKINLHVEPNRIVALIGPTGSGKTSLVNLIPRFYDVTSGAVRIDGLDVREVTAESLRRQIGVVLQDTFLFSATVMENIRFGRPEATEAEIAELFKPFGQVTSVQLMRELFTGKLRGFGFVEMPGKAQSLAAIAGVNGKELGGHVLKVNEARPRPERGSRR